MYSTARIRGFPLLRLAGEDRSLLLPPPPPPPPLLLLLVGLEVPVAWRAGLDGRLSSSSSFFDGGCAPPAGSDDPCCSTPFAPVSATAAPAPADVGKVAVSSAESYVFGLGVLGKCLLSVSESWASGYRLLTGMSYVRPKFRGGDHG